MTLNTEDLLNSIIESLSRIEYIKPGEIPNIDLYMDQVTTFMDSRLKHSTRNPADDKILTKTMINNYAKNDLLPPPVKKKYSKEHVLLLIFIYYFKGILSINDIQNLLCPITERFFGKDQGFHLEDLYNEVFALEADMVEDMKADIKDKYLRAQDTFGDAPKEDQEFLKTFAFICMLSVDVYVKKLMIETLIDSLPVFKGEDISPKGENKKSEAKKEAKKAEEEKPEGKNLKDK